MVVLGKAADLLELDSASATRSLEHSTCLPAGRGCRPASRCWSSAGLPAFGCRHIRRALLEVPPGWCAALRSLFLAAWFFGTPLCRRRSTALLRTPPPGLRMAVLEFRHQKGGQTPFATGVPACGVLPKAACIFAGAGLCVVVVDVRICEELGRAKTKDMLESLSGGVLNCRGLNPPGGGLLSQIQISERFVFTWLWPLSAPALFEQTPHRSTSRYPKNPPVTPIYASRDFPSLSMTFFGSCGLPPGPPPPPIIPPPRVIHDSAQPLF